jgi:putative ABC transport system ATP-binding protein
MNRMDADVAGGPPPLYRLDGLGKAYGGSDTAVTAVDGMELEIGRGEFVVVAGPSGSGKSTLLQLLGALDRPSAGLIEFEGRDLARLGDKELADLRRKTLGFIFQQFNLIPTLSARENVEIALAPGRLAAERRAGRALDLLGGVGLAERADHLPSQVSGGEQQRVAIARALANEPDVLLADEPTGNLDTRTGEAILSLLYRLWQEAGLTVVLVSHDPAIADDAPRLIRLADGRVVEDTRKAASCDDSASITETTIPATAPEALSGEQQDQVAELRQCLSEQGVERPQPGSAQGPSPEMLQALQECQQYVPEWFGLVP